jgi:hypothetical protein
MKLGRFLAAAMLLALAAIPTSASQAASALGSLAAPRADTLVEKAWGNHSTCEWGRRAGWHRHTYYGRIVPCHRDRGYDAYDDYDDYSYTSPSYPSYPSYPNYPSYYDSPSYYYLDTYTYTQNNTYWRPRPQTCRRDWHCVDNGNPFDGKRNCFWRRLCN